MALRYYANAPATALASGCTAGAATVVVNAVTGFPVSYPYTIIVDRGQATEEVMEVTNAAGTTLTVTRGADSTTAFAHGTGAVVEHGISARDVREPNTHVNANNNVHGVSGSVVGTSDTQTLTNKDLSSGTNTFPSTLATDAELSTHAGTASSVHGVTGSLVGTSDTQTLTNKTLGSTNTINGFTASRFMEADGTGKLASGSKTIPSGAVVGTTDTQTLTNKTLTNPVVSGTVTKSGESWTAVTFQNGYANNGSFVTQYRKLPDGLVVVSGLVSGGTDNAVIFNLPAGYRPANPESFGCFGGGGATRVDVQTSGDVKIITPTSGSGASSTSLCFSFYVG